MLVIDRIAIDPTVELAFIARQMRIDLMVVATFEAPASEVLTADIPTLMELADEHLSSSDADDYADLINACDPSQLCDRYGDWCEFSA